MTVTINGSTGYSGPIGALTVPVGSITATGTPSSTTYLRGDSTWATVAGSPAGEIMFYAANSAPTGYLKANGAAVSRTTYATLFTAIGTTFGTGDGSTTFNVPDMRGYFARGWVDNGTIDSGRAFGSTQTGMVGTHNHIIDSYFSYSSVAPSYIAAGNAAGGAGTSRSTNNNSGTETRPVNIAFLGCIKY